MERLSLEIITPERVLVRQEADIVEAPGTEGEFGVLPGHVTFLSTLERGEVRFVADGKTRFIATSGGFAEVRDNKVTLLLDTAEFGEDIDLAKAVKARERAESGLKGLSFDHEEYASLESAIEQAVTGTSATSKASPE